jgi:2-polyprenyl-3-methyl-5-hydroxy-6-metoxy-1,4-benzoquinol methylase
MIIGEEIKHNTFRDTNNYYLDAPSDMFSSKLIDFALQHCGKRILDLGCATGNYTLELSKRGYTCIGADVNSAYIEIAQKRGIEAYVVSDKLPFSDKSFDSVIMFEVVEHLSNPEVVLSEASRVARKNVIISVPNCEGYEELKKQGLIYEHFLDRDHKNMFTETSLRKMLSGIFPVIDIQKGDPIYPLSLADLSKNIILRVLNKIHLIRPKYYFRLYVVAHIQNLNK